MNSALGFEGVSFGFDERRLFEKISFFLPEGVCTALIGPNGAGKTTLLRLAMGLLRPASGSISAFGENVAALDPRHKARLIALVPQQVTIPFDFTVREIVEQGRTPYLRLFGGLARADRAAVEEAMRLADVDELENRVFNDLSGGEQQRVKIALGLAQQPRLLLLDEPTQNLDVGRQAELLELLGQFRREGITVVAAMHHLELIEGTFSSVMLVTAQGTLLLGSPKEILRPAILEPAFNCPPRALATLDPSMTISKEQMA
ncbi:MAG: ABC transporter ATP-binding protein [Acidobacteria bacterium]|nr:ABC transporter ATP-binding protein [Acidobacteriota bacterium]